MKKLTFKVVEDGEFYDLEIITDRTPQWTIDQYSRHRYCTMELVNDEPTNETESTFKKISL